jgi:chloramphenicol-sensitive protein RarD
MTRSPLTQFTSDPAPLPEAVLVADLPANSAGWADRRTGILYGLSAFGLWALFPVYFKAVAHVPALEVLAHRVCWSLLFLVALTCVRRSWRTVFAVMRCRRALGTLCLTTALIAGNWGMFIWAVAQDHLLQASLGYFINPLVNVLLGFVFLRERLRPWQLFSVLLAAVGVGYLTVARGEFPGIALFLAGSFGFYGLLRKTARVEALTGLTIETALLTTPALAYLIYQRIHGQAAFGSGSLSTDLLLASAGFITATPLLWFAEAAHRLRLTTLGFLQYLSPTGQFLLAVLAYGEPFSHSHAVAFGFIWAAIGVYLYDTAVRARKS